MLKHMVVLGGGTAGTLMANRMVRLLPHGWRVTVVDRDDAHVYQPGLLFLPFGDAKPEQLVRPRRRLFERGIEVKLEGLDRVDAQAKTVRLLDGSTLKYDVLIIATGSRITPEETQGLTGEGWRATAFDFYTLAGATALGHALERFEGGRLLINIAELPIKCPVAPLEFAFLADDYFKRKGRREKVELVYVTPLEGAFTKPKASAVLGDLLARKGVKVVGDFSVSQVDGGKRVLSSFDGRSEPYDLLVSIPLHAGDEAMKRSGLGDESGWVPTDKHTLQSKAHPDIFVLGDATDLPASKAGAVAHFQGDVLAENLLRHIEGRPVEPSFDGHANCFIETGAGKAMLIDFNYETEPLPGRFPLPGVGPFTLLEESAVNHWGKKGFEWLYWNGLVTGKDLPFEPHLALAGKWR